MIGEFAATLSLAPAQPKATSGKPKSDHGQLHSVTHHIPPHLRRRGSEMRLVLPAAGPLLPELEPDATLLQAIARAHLYRQL